LRRILLVKVIICILVWGLPTPMCPPTLLNLFGVEMPDELTTPHGFGILGLAYC